MNPSIRKVIRSQWWTRANPGFLESPGFKPRSFHFLSPPQIQIVEMPADACLYESPSLSLFHTPSFDYPRRHILVAAIHYIPPLSLTNYIEYAAQQGRSLVSPTTLPSLPITDALMVKPGMPQ